MSWRQISRPEPLPQGPEEHRREAAQKIADWYTGGIERGELGDRIDHLVGRRDRDIADMIRDLGGVKGTARQAGVSERTVRDWRSGRHSPTPAHRESLERSARKATVDALGGTKAVAQLAGRSAGTVRGWVRKKTQAKGDATHQLNIHEVRQRHVEAQQRRGRDPAAPLTFTATGHVRVRTTTPTPPYDYDRAAQHTLDEDVQGNIEGAIARGDTTAAQQAIEQSLTADYAGLGDDLYNGRDLGFFFDRIDDIT